MIGQDLLHGCFRSRRDASQTKPVAKCPEAPDEDIEDDFRHAGVDLAALQAPRRAATERIPYQQPEVERAGANQQAFENVRVTAQVGFGASRPVS
jgi:hypothetical protein